MKEQISLSSLEEYIDFGIIESVYVVPMPMSDKWVLWVGCNNGEEKILATARGDNREFATLKTVVEVLKHVGWKKPVILHLD